ncbi:heme exporter protein CcmB [Leptothrix cholodnii SP-6]|uniref:Heme exporter protein B n=1 Tax=Leptothrix cholodnii (strain ATCC 51168 / LMG 8142 / SP-6) TaxID=395495 RepID=B1XWE5_LEPCP|nr:heme exporter protein CcmB [Leptothrix cholodnii]ACB33813.1 heme exporter protein CcmB [Leptothrix cholodnii SP-6]
MSALITSEAEATPDTGFAPLLALVMRDLRLAARRRSEAALPLVFFIVAAGLFPLGVGPETETLRQIAPGVVWVCALLAAMLSINQLYAADHADGSLEQMLLSGQPLALVALARSLSHWLLTGLPLVLTAPLFGVMFDLSAEGIGSLVIGLLLGTPVLSLLGNVGAALTLGLRSGGMLVFLLVLPLAVPVLIFGTGAVAAVEVGMSPQPHYALLGALLIATAGLAPLASGAALRISTE